jgi:hypothetical protein
VQTLTNVTSVPITSESPGWARFDSPHFSPPPLFVQLSKVQGRGSKQKLGIILQDAASLPMITSTKLRK